METYNVRYTGKDELRSAVLCLKCNSIKPERAHHCSVSTEFSVLIPNLVG